LKIAVNVEAVGARRGGAEKYAGSLVRSLADAGHQVSVVARLVDPGELPSGVRHLPVPLSSSLLLKPLRSYRFARASQRVLQGESWDLIIGLTHVWHQHAMIAVSGAQPASLAANSRRFRGAPRRWLWWATKLIGPKLWMHRWIQHKQFGEYRPHLVVPARMVAEHFHRYHGVPYERISVIPWGIESGRPVNDAPTVRTMFRWRQGLREDDVAVLFAAHNYELKGLEPLLEAFALVAGRLPQLKMLVCGSKKDRAYRRQAERLGIAERVRFLGFVEDIRHPFVAADVFAFPTFYDPCSLVVLEAMRAGLPVITTDQNGAAELYIDGREGFKLASPWAIDTLADRLAVLAGNTELREQMGRAAREASARFAVVDRTTEMLAALEKAAADPAAAPQGAGTVRPHFRRAREVRTA